MNRGGGLFVALFGMNKSSVYAFFLILAIGLQGCSWIEEFVVFNTSNKVIYIAYELDTVAKGSFPIFTHKPTAHYLNSSGEIDWEKEEISLNDKDTSSNLITVSVLPNSALVLGTLHNDKYTRYDQQFINGRWFNLRKIRIQYENKVLEICPSTFDKFFKKHSGKIGFTVE